MQFPALVNALDIISQEFHRKFTEREREFNAMRIEICPCPRKIGTLYYSDPKEMILTLLQHPK